MYVLADENLSLIKVDTFPDDNDLVHRFVFDLLRSELPDSLHSVVTYSVYPVSITTFRCHLHFTLDFYLECDASIEGPDIFANFRTLCRDVAIYLRNFDEIS